MNYQILYQIHLCEITGYFPLLDMIEGGEREIFRLIASKHLEIVQQNRLRLTDLGRVEVFSALQNTTLTPRNYKAFIDEALTGTTSTGLETQIKNACIPKHTTNHEPSYEMDFAFLDVVQQIRKLSEESGKDPLEVCEFFADGRVGKCPGCKRVGLFGRNASKTSGRQTYCIKCKSANYSKRKGNSK